MAEWGYVSRFIIHRMNGINSNRTNNNDSSSNNKTMNLAGFCDYVRAGVNKNKFLPHELDGVQCNTGV